jgi:multiple sugar transport system permease protein
MRTVRGLPIPAAAVRHTILLVSSLLMLVPFLWMVSLSLKPPEEITQLGLALLPSRWFALENYSRAFTAAPLPRFLLNGLFVCGAIVILQVLIALPIAYALAKLHFPGRRLLFAMVLLGLVVPGQVRALPLFILAYKLHILDSYAAQIVPFAVSPFGIFLFRQFFMALPDELLQAARLDGLGEVAIIRQIAAPMILPALIAFSIFSVVGHWNELFWPLIAIRSEALMPPALGIVSLSNSEAGDDAGAMMASAVITVAPLVLAFLAAQRWFVEGLTAGAVK